MPEQFEVAGDKGETKLTKPMANNLREKLRAQLGVEAATIGLRKDIELKAIHGRTGISWRQGQETINPK